MASPSPPGRCCMLLLIALSTLLVTTTTIVNATDPPGLTVWTGTRTGGAIDVSWQVVPDWLDANGGVGVIAGYTVSCDGAQVADLTTQELDSGLYQLTGLINNTEYTIQVRGKLTVNTAVLESAALVTQTLDRSVPGRPPTPTVLTVGGGSMRLRVDPPLDTGGGPIKFMTVIVRSTGEDRSIFSATVGDLGDREVAFYGLNARTMYRIYVTATTPGPQFDLTGFPSYSIYETTRGAEWPGPCPAPVLLGVTGGSVRLQLMPPVDDGGSRISGYLVFMAANGSGLYEPVGDTTGTEAPGIVEISRVPGLVNVQLRPLTRYDFKAIALNANDVCVNPNAPDDRLATAGGLTAWTVSPSLPDPPPPPYFLSASGGHLTIQLLMPLNMKGATLTGFAIMANETMRVPIGATGELPYDLDGLTAQSNVTIRVAVTTDIGTTGLSEPVTMTTTPPTAPSAPLNAVVSNVTSSRARVSWSPPTDTGGVLISVYRLMIVSPTGTQSRSTSATTFDLNGLAASTVYTIKLTAINSAGLVTSSRVIAPGVTFQTLEAMVPSAPRGLTMISSTGGALEAAWLVPLETGGVLPSTLIYNVTLFSIISCFDSSAGSPCGSCDFVQQSGNDQYEMVLGISACEAPSGGVCPDGTTQCCVSRPDSVFGGGYLCGRVGSTPARTRIVVGSTMTTISGLSSSTAYYVGVQAINHMGASEFTTIAGMHTSVSTAPSYPQNLRPLGGTGGSMQLTWDPPLDTGGGPVIGYMVYRDYRLLTPQPVLPPFYDCGGGLLASTEYRYGVAAVNGSRAIGAVSSVTLITQPMSPPLTPSVEIISRAMTWANVSVAPACDSGGAPAVNYQYMLLRDATTILSSSFFSCCSTLLTGLEVNRAYELRVRAIHERGESAWQISTLMTTSGIPATPMVSVQRASSFSALLGITAAGDHEIFAFQVTIYRNNELLRGMSIPCEPSPVDPSLRTCPGTIRVDGLSPSTDYVLQIQANGPMGSSDWATIAVSTGNEAPGTFELEATEYNAVSGGSVNITITRSGGTAGTQVVQVNVVQPTSVVLNCATDVDWGCRCSLHLAGDGTPSQVGELTFLDGQEQKFVVITLWQDDRSVSQSLTAVLGLLGNSAISPTKATTLVRIDRSLNSGFIGFARSRSWSLENATHAKINLVRLNGTSGGLDFDVETFDLDSNGLLMTTHPYIPVAKTLHFDDRQSVASLWIRILDNWYFDGSHTFGVRLRARQMANGTGPSLLGSVITHRVVIVEDEDLTMQRPVTPGGLHTTYATGGELGIEWGIADNTSAPAGGYIVRASTSASVDGSNFFTLYNVTEPRLVLSGLQPTVVYRFEVAAWNQFGASEFGSVLFAMTTEPTPPSAPQALRQVTATSSTVTIAWEPPRDTGGLNVTSYALWLGLGGGGEGEGWTKLASAWDPSTTSYVVTGLVAMTTRHIRVAAATAMFPATDTSVFATLNASTSGPTLPLAPPAPTLLQPPASGTLAVGIQLPVDMGGSPMVDYELHMQPLDTTSDPPAPSSAFEIVCTASSPVVNSLARSCMVPRLLASTSYEFFVVVWNTVGPSPPGPRAIFRTTSTIELPSPPSNFRATRVTAGLIELSWDPPLDYGGAREIIGYSVYQKVDVFFSDQYFTVYDGQDNPTRSVTLRGLARGMAYAFAVVAWNSASFCANPNVYHATPFVVVNTLPYSRVSPPGTPWLISRTGGAITIAWSAPDDLAGVPLSGYLIELVPVNGTSISLTPDPLAPHVTNFRHNGLLEQTEYRYAIIALNADGPSEPSAVGIFQTTPCSMPQFVEMAQVAEASGGRLRLTWAPPLDSGGRPIEYYQIRRLGRTESFSTVATAFVDVYGLVAFGNYQYEIRAFNGLYMGPSAYVWATTTSPTVPAPMAIRSVVPYGGKIDVTWAAPDDTGGASLTGFGLSLKLGNETIAEAHVAPGVSSWTFQALRADTEYEVVGIAENSLGPSAEVGYFIFTGEVDLPGPPPAPTFTEVLGGSLVVHVQPPSYTGGENVTLTLWKDGQTIYEFAPDETSTTIVGLLAMTEYRFLVVATNSRGATVGLEASVQTSEITTPGNVTSAVELVTASFDRMTIHWTPVTITGGDPGLQYMVSFYMCEASTLARVGDETDFITVPGPTAVVLGLAYSTTYCLSVTPVTTTLLYGGASPVAAFTTEAPISGRVIAQTSALSVREDNATVVIPVLRVDGSFGNASFSYWTVDETAVSGTNYIETIGTQILAANVQSGIITIPLLNDVVYDPVIAFTVMIQDDLTSSRTETHVTLTDDGDAGLVAFDTEPIVYASEGAVTFSIPIVRTRALAPEVTVGIVPTRLESTIPDRFVLLTDNVTFAEGEATHALELSITNDLAYQHWGDSIVYELRVLDGGAWLGDVPAVNITLIDDGDVSLPEACTGLRELAVSGGFMHVAWTPPVDRGSATLPLTFVLDFALDGEVVKSLTTPNTALMVFGLNASTTYEVSVRAANVLGPGEPTNVLLLGTMAPTPASAPLYVQLLGASSSSATLTWEPSNDDGGSRFLGYAIYRILPSGELEAFSMVTCTTPTLCTVRGLTALTTYELAVAATTLAIGRGTLSEPLTLQTPQPVVPDPPPLAAVTWKSAGALRVQMFAPVNVGGSEIRAFRLFIRGPGDVLDPRLVYEGAGDTFTIFRLERATPYEITYEALNLVGPSPPSAVLQERTLERSLPSAPLGLAVLQVTGGAVSLTWGEPEDLGGRPITGYEVFIQSAPDAPLTADTVGYEGKGDPRPQGVVYGLMANTTYSLYAVTLTEVSSCFDRSAWVRSNPVLRVTTLLPTLPGTPPSLTLARVTGGLIELVWTPPRDTGGVPVDLYNIHVVTPTQGLVLVSSTPGNGVLAFSHTDLAESTTYTYVLSVVTRVGTSPLTAQLTAKTTVASPPSAPLNVRQLETVVSGGAIALGWDRPLDAGGQPLRGYWLYRDGVAIAQNIAAGDRTYVDKAGLLAQTSYEYRLRAYSMSSMGSELSFVMTARTTTATRPKPPLVTGIVQGSSSLTPSWRADADTGGLPIQLFEARLLIAATGAEVEVYTGPDTTHIFTRLTSLTAYVLRVKAINAMGSSDGLEVSVTTAKLSLPSAPSAPTVVSVFGGTFTIQCFIPVDSGGAMISAFKLYEQRAGFIATIPTTLLGLWARYTVLNTTSSTDYTLTISAVNSLGEGPQSPPRIVRTGPMNAPGPLTAAPQVGSVTGTSLFVLWSAATDTGGDPGVTYELRLVDSVLGTSSIYPSVSRQYNVTQLKYNNLYAASVRVVNRIGKSDWSPTVSGRTLLDAAGEFSFTTTAVNVREDAGTVSLAVSRSNGISGKVTLTYAVGPGASPTASVGSDYALTAGSVKTVGTVIFESQQTQANITILILNDAVYEPDEQFAVNLASTNGGKLVAPTRAVVTIQDDGDAGYISFSAPKYSVSEAAPAVVLPIIREGGTYGRISLLFSFNDSTASADRDYRRVLTPVIMETGQKVAELRVPIINDRVFEYPDEQFVVWISTLTNGAIARQNVAVVTILDDGDQSVPATCPLPAIATMTGGAVSLQVGLPAHNGSAKGILSSYAVRVTSVTGAVNHTRGVSNFIFIGGLTAVTSYQVSIAANNSVGQGPFSDVLNFTTSDATLPGTVSGVRLLSSSGGSVTLTWLPPEDSGGVPITKYRIYNLNGTTGQPRVAVELSKPDLVAKVSGLKAGTKYRFAVQAGNAVMIPEFANGWGVLSGFVEVTTSSATLPGPLVVEPVAYADPTGGSVTPSWRAPADTGGVPIRGYNVYARNATSPFFLALNASHRADLNGTVPHLYADNWYELFVLADNGVPPMALAVNVTINAGTRSMVTNVDLSLIVSTGSVLSVQGAIFVIGDMSKATKSSLPLAITYTSTSIINKPPLLLGTATSFTNLSTSAATLPRLPPVPTLLNATGGAIAILVDSPEDTGGVPIVGFKVYVNDQEADTETIQTELVGVTALKQSLFYRVAGLSPWTGYAFTAIAQNAISLCDFRKKVTTPPVWYTTLSPTRPEAVAPMPQYITGGGMTLSAPDPFDDGGSPITRYSFYISADVVPRHWRLIYSGPKRQTVVARLIPEKTYFLSLSLFNGYFESANASETTVATQAISPPGQCAEPVLAQATGGMLEVTWDPPIDDGGAAVVDYTLTLLAAQDGSGRQTWPMLKARRYAFYGLVADTDYKVSVQAQNEKGLGPDGAAATLRTLEGSAPQGPINVTVLSSTGGATFIRFNEPEDFGGANREDMSYAIYADGGLMRTVSFADLEESQGTDGGRRRRRRLREDEDSEHHRRLASSGGGIVVGGLDPLMMYNIQVQAINTYAQGNVSSSTPATTTAATIPSALVDLQISARSGGSITLTWSPPQDTGGLPVDRYDIYMGSAASGPFTTPCQETVTLCRVLGLTPGATYYFYGVVVNALGESPKSDVIHGPTASISPPSVPGNVQITSVSSTTIVCEWAAPVDAGGDVVASYEVTIEDKTNGGTSVSTTTTRTLTFPGLLAGTEYWITVVALNSFQDTSQPTPPRIVTTSATANAPTDPVATCVGSTSISLQWFPFPSASQYRVYQDGVVVSTGSTTDVTLTNIATNQLSAFEIEAEIGGAWTGTRSSSVLVQTASAQQTEIICESMNGYIRELNYQSLMHKAWNISIVPPYNYLTLKFLSFNLECDHDQVRITNANDHSLVWSGGCQRDGPFLLQVDDDVQVTFTSDATVSKSGFELFFEANGASQVDSPTRIPHPGPSTAICARHGLRSANGKCKCSVGYTGESCNNRVICCSNPTRCDHPVCDLNPAKVIAVSDELGDDVDGTGAMMDTSEDGTASKAVKSLSRALSLATNGSVILLYPGEYKGPLNRNLEIALHRFSFTSVKGYAWTTLDCEGATRGLLIQTSTVTMQGLTIRNCANGVGAGGAIGLLRSTVTLRDVLITTSTARDGGGGMFASGSTVELIDTAITLTQGALGGGVYLVDSTMIMTNANITNSTATDGGGLAVIGTSDVSGTSSALIKYSTATASGGGVVVGGMASLRGLVVASNQATTGAGVGISTPSTVSTRDMVITGNHATASGGGLALVGTITLTGANVVLEKNTATIAGGGIHIQGATGKIHFEDFSNATRSLLVGNEADEGGGLHVLDSSVSLRGLRLKDGLSRSGGGGSIVHSDLVVRDAYVAGNKAQVAGGGLVIKDATVSFQGITVIEANNATLGGGLMLDRATVAAESGRVEDNTADDRGGGLHISQGASVRGLAVRTCHARGGGGGGLYVAAATATLVDLVVSRCSSDHLGGGMVVNASTLTTTNVTIDGGAADFGGGLASNGATTIRGSLRIQASVANTSGGGLHVQDTLELTSTTVTTSTALLGGGLYAANASIRLRGVQLADCAALVDGAGVYVLGTTVEMTDATLSGHHSAARGGGVFLGDQSSLAHANMTLRENRAMSGGGVYVADSVIRPQSPTSLTSVLVGNTATARGGNVLVTGNSSMTALDVLTGAAAKGAGLAIQNATVVVENCLITGNRATSTGGGISLEDGSRLDLVNTDVSTNRVDGGTGGGLTISQSVVRFRDVTMAYNGAMYGGGLYVEGTSSFLPLSPLTPLAAPARFNESRAMLDAKTRGNGSTIFVAPQSVFAIDHIEVRGGNANMGGGIFVDRGAKLTLTRGAFLENVAVSGAALYATIKTDVTIEDCEFVDNNANSSGGAITLAGFQSAMVKASVKRSRFADNSASSIAGAVEVSYGDVTIANATFVQNHVVMGRGGALAAYSKSLIRLRDCNLTWNGIREDPFDATTMGGMLFLEDVVSAELVRTTMIREPKSTRARLGGILYAQGAASVVQVENCELAVGRGYSGGAIYVKDAQLTVLNSTIRDGDAYEFGAGIYADSGAVLIQGSTLVANTAFYDGGAIYSRGGGSLTVLESIITRNEVQDSGGGIFVAPGAAMVANITATVFSFNTNVGLGSALYVGRKNTLHLQNSTFSRNGGDETESASLYAADATVHISDSEFSDNAADRAAAAEFSRDTKAEITSCVFNWNQASNAGGALSTSVRANVTITDSTFQDNHAKLGGAINAQGSSWVILHNVTGINNHADSVGGWLLATGWATVDILDSTITRNTASLGGALGIGDTVTLVLRHSDLTANTADVGGGLYLDSATATEAKAIRVSGVVFQDNSAVAGPDVYWVYHPKFAFECLACVSMSSARGTPQMTTTPVSIHAGWWPSVVTSGVSLGISSSGLFSNGTSSRGDAPPHGSGSASMANATSGTLVINRRLGADDDPATLAAILRDPTMTSPDYATLWPTVVVRDYYGAVAVNDQQAKCVARKIASDTDRFLFFPANEVVIQRGYVTFVDALISSRSRATPYQLNVTCTLSDEVTTSFVVNITVANCNKGYQNVDGLCQPCKKGTYSLDGVKCYPCPLGASCEQVVDGTLVGVSIPSRSEGYFLAESRQSFQTSQCSDPSTWDADDPCRGVSLANLTYMLLECSKLRSFDQYWPRKRIFACLSGKEYYTCDTRDACASESAVSLSEFRLTGQCEKGYGSVMCATCLNGFYKVSNGMCKPCSNSTDPAVHRTATLMAMIPIGFMTIAFFVIWYYFSNAGEAELMRQARAARKYQIYNRGTSQSILRRMGYFVEERIQHMLNKARERFVARRKAILFDIRPRQAPMPSFRAEKFKILLGFFQIFGGFKKMYEIPWPAQMSRLMDVFSIADFNLVDTTAIECFFHRDYFTNFKLSISGILILLALTTLLLSWGVARYRVKLASLPRHCVRCGLPVFQMIRQKPKTLVRRSTMVSMIRAQQKLKEEKLRRRSLMTRVTERAMTRADTTFENARKWFNSTRLGKVVDRVVIMFRLPGSASLHHPTCPTSQQIQAEVLGMVIRSNIRLWRARVRLRLNYQTFKNKCIKLFFWIMLLFYPVLSQRAIGMFYCDEIGRTYFMSRDKSQLCYQGRWLRYLPLSVLLLVVWVTGVPLLFWMIIFMKRRSGIEEKLLLLEEPANRQLKTRLLAEMRQDLISRGVHIDEDKLVTFEREFMTEYLRNKKLNEPSMVAQVGFIYHSYKTSFWWFEVWDLGRKLCLNCIIGLLAKTGANRIIAGLIVFLIYLSVMLFYQPYKERSDSALAGITQIQLFVTLFCGLILKMGSVHLEDSVISLLTYIAFFSNFGTIAYAVFVIIYEKYDAMKRTRRRIREEHRRAIQQHVRKLWHQAYGFAFTEVYLRDPSIRPMPIQVILELARRDRTERKTRSLQLALDRTSQVEYSDAASVSTSQIDLDLPRPPLVNARAGDNQGAANDVVDNQDREPIDSGINHQGEDPEQDVEGHEAHRSGGE